jgi:hypothetical protein
VGSEIGNRPGLEGGREIERDRERDRERERERKRERKKEIDVPVIFRAGLNLSSEKPVKYFFLRKKSPTLSQHKD